MRPHILWVVYDTARADVFEPYGAARGATPALAQLAARGAAHRAYAPASWTVPSHVGMLSGSLPRAVGLGQAPGGSPHGCRPLMEANRGRLVPEVLRRAGYRTRGVSCNLWVGPEAGFATGFDDFHHVRSTRHECFSIPGLRGRLRWAMEGLRSEHDDGAAEVERVLTSWITDAADGQQPQLWFVNLIECHSPYLPPKPYNDLNAIDRLRAADEARRHLTLGEIWRNCVAEFDIPAEALERMRHLYGKSIGVLDDWLGRVLERLDATGLLDDTLVIVTSDHGENLGEGDLIGHSFSLDDRLISVPLVIAGPGAPPGDGIMRLTDLPRVVAAATGIDDHPWQPSPLPDGVAVSQLDPMVTVNDPRTALAVEQWKLDGEQARALTEPMTLATDGHFKLLRHGSEEALIDLDVDPLEVAPRPLTAETSAAAAGASPALRAALDHPSVWESATPPADLPDVPDDEREALEAQMKLLGYM